MAASHSGQTPRVWDSDDIVWSVSPHSRYDHDPQSQKADQTEVKVERGIGFEPSGDVLSVARDF